MRKLLLFSWMIGLWSLTHAQIPAPTHASKILHELQKLNVLGSVLYVAAHPDDENTRLISWLSNEKKYRTAYLSLTRGDGGQNLIGDEQGVELGLIRSQELLAARRIDGGEQFFTRAYDFGYSKNPEETFRIWGRDSILADVVWVIRRFQPDVIITRFPVTGEGGHGHHTASAILANEAFRAAGDPKRFPEQLRYVSVWQPKRILWNTFNFGGANTTAAGQFKLDVGGFNALLGKSYGELAAESRSQHKSQGFGVPATRGESFEYFKNTGGDDPVTDLLDGVRTEWSRLQGAQGLALLIDSLIAQFDPIHPERSVPGLLHLYKRVSSLPLGVWTEHKRARIQELLLQCAGFYTEAIAAQPEVIVGDSLRFNMSLIARRANNFTLQSVSIDNYDSVFNYALPLNRAYNRSFTIRVPDSYQTTQPYWLLSPMQPGRFTVTEQLLIGVPENKSAFSLKLRLRVGDDAVDVSVPVNFKFTDPVKGELYKSLVVRPALELDAAEEISFHRPGERSTLSFQLKANRPISAQTIQARHASNKVELNTTPPMERGITLTRSRSVDVPTGDYRFESVIKKGEVYTQGGRLTRIRYDYIPELHYFNNRAQRVRMLDLKTAGKQIGYIVGAGDKIPDALERMGYEVVLIGEKDLAKLDLNRFDAIVTGVRAYNTHAWLNDVHDRLMKYVEQGGNLIVQYNTSNQIGPVRAKIGPYPFQITRNRVTDEQAAVTFLEPTHPVFQWPNQLGSSDFEDWVQERSIYHGVDTSGRFQRLLSMSDPGERSEDGSLMVARYGKGWFTYTGLSLFRQLPAGVVGAYRLLANLIALNQKQTP